MVNLVTEVFEPQIRLERERRTATGAQIERMKKIGVDLHQNNRKMYRIRRKARTIEDQIKHVCIKYDLKYLPLSHYAKMIPEDNIQEIEAYMAVNRTYQLMIIAPSSHFGKESIALKVLDPVVLDTAPIIAKLVTTWGNDFSKLRRLRGLWVNSRAFRLFRRAFYPAIPFFLPLGSFSMGFSSALIATLLILWAYAAIKNDDLVYRAEWSYCTKDYPLIWWL